MAYYGRRRTSDTDTGATINTTQRGQIYKAISQHGWAYAVGCLGGKAPGEPNLSWRGALWDVSGAAIDDRMAYTGAVAVSNTMSFGGDGEIVAGALITPVQLWSGVKYGIGWSVTGGQFNHGMSQAAKDPPESEDYYFHYRNTGTNVPTDPFGATSSSYEGTMTSYVEYEPNTAPSTITGTMSPAGFIASATPDFSGDFTDSNEDRGDKLKQFQVQVYRVSDNVKMWDSTQSATSAEQTARRFTAGYAGTALASGVEYRWRYRVSDQFGVWSSYSTYQSFTVNSGGAVNVSTGTPTGKQETVTPEPFTGVWSHPSGFGTNAVEVRIKQGNTIIRTSPTIAQSVANGATLSVTWAATAFAALNWGQSLTYELRARDTSGLWSPWSSARAFTTNAQPSTPAIILPSNGQVMSTRPLVSVQCSDVDDTPATGLAVSLRIKDDAGAVLFTRAMTFNVDASAWEYQTTATDLATFAAYRLDASATDGTVTTPASAEVTFTYGQGPVITVTNPGADSTITTNVPIVSFTQDSTQTTYRVLIYEWVNSTLSLLVYDSGVVTLSAAAGVTVNHPIPSGYLHNDTSYRLIISSTNDLALTGTHAGVTFTLSFPAPAPPANYLASPIRVGNDATPSAILLSWDEPAYSSSDFRAAVVTRRELGQSIGEALILARMTSTSEYTFVDYYPVSGQLYTYAVFFEVIQGTDETESVPSEADALVQLEHVVINSVLDGRVRVGLRYGQPMQLDYDDETVEVHPWGQSLPHTFVSDVDRRKVKGTYKLHDDRYSTGLDDLAGLRDLRAKRSITCYRDQYGDRIFGYLKVAERKGQRDSKAEVSLALNETSFTEGES